LTYLVLQVELGLTYLVLQVELGGKVCVHTVHELHAQSMELIDLGSQGLTGPSASHMVALGGQQSCGLLHTVFVCNKLLE
jgi:hypothetical protein